MTQKTVTSEKYPLLGRKSFLFLSVCLPTITGRGIYSLTLMETVQRKNHKENDLFRKRKGGVRLWQFSA